MQNRTCPACGQQVTGRPNKIFCSKRCRCRAAKARKSALSRSETERLSTTVGACEECGASMTLAVPRKCGGFTKRRFCSVKCQDRAKQRRFRQTDTFRSYYSARIESGKWAEGSRRMRARRRRYETAICPYCGTAFQKVVGSRKTLCGSEACESARNLARCHERNARKKMVQVEHFSRLSVFERDGWVCQICGEAIDRDAVAKSPLSASLDHIIPLSKGGEHSMSNTQCSHLRCNMMKSDKMPTVRLA